MNFSVEDLNDIFEVFYSISDVPPILFLDEIRNVDGWKSLLEESPMKKIGLYHGK